MKRKMNNVLCILLVLTMVFTCFQIQPASAGTTYTKSKINSMIKQKQKELKAVQKKQNAEQKKFSQQTKGTVSIVLGNVRSTNPYIVYDSLSGSTYWITNPDNMTNFLSSASGYIKTTGEYRTYNYTTCAVAKAVKVTANPKKYDKKIQALKDKIYNLKGALISYVIFPANAEENSDFAVGETRTLSWYWSKHYSTPYTSVTFTSSDPSVLKILDKKKCKVKALQDGTSTIIAWSKVSGKTTEITLEVLPEPGKYGEITDCEFGINSEGDGVEVYLELDSDKPLQSFDPDIRINGEENLDIAQDSVSLFYDDENKIVVFLDLKKEGVVPLTLTAKSGFTKTVDLEVYKGEDGNLHIRIYS